jgi:hypothetical protein
MRSLRRLGSLILLGFGLAACGGNPVEPSAGTPAGARLTVLGDSVVTMSPGESLTLKVQETDTSGRVVESAQDTYTWTSSEPGTIAVVPGGVLRAGPGLGYSLIVVRAPSGVSASVHGWVQVPQGAPSPFRIALMYADDVPEAWRAALAQAAERWQQMIRGELPEASLHAVEQRCPSVPPIPPLTGVTRGVRIFVGVGHNFERNTYVEAVGGPCVQRPLPHPTTILGRIVLNADKPVEAIGSPRLRYVATHEMGHALGLVALIQGLQPWWFDPPSRVYKGPLGLEGYRREFGAQLPEIVLPGGAHWPFVGDIMGAQVHRISFVSVGALMDLGYPAAWYGAH